MLPVVCDYFQTVVAA